MTQDSPPAGPDPAVPTEVGGAAAAASPAIPAALGPSPSPGQGPSPSTSLSSGRLARRPARGQIAAWSAAVLFAAVAGRFAPISAPAEFAVLGSGLVVFVRALRTPAGRRRPAPERVDGRGSLVWLGLLAVFLVWELFAFARGSTPAHPTLSILVGPLLAEPLFRSACYLLWLAAGAWLARR